jgi:hypothetical protein
MKSGFNFLLMALFALTCQARVGGLEFPYVARAEVVSTWQQAGDYAELELPRSLSLQGRPLESIIRRGDPVEIFLGYDGDLVREFSGYVSRIHPETPLRLECEDGIFLLKGQSYTASFRSARLADVVSLICGNGIEFEARDVSLGSYVIKQATGAQVLDDLRSRYGLPAWFRDGKLHAGAAYSGMAARASHAYVFGRNVAESRLRYQRREDFRVKVKAVSILPDNSRIEAEAGDPSGEVRTMHFFNIRSREDLAKIAEESISRIKVDGFSGEITGFGRPWTRHGDIIEIRDADYRGDRSGAYFIDKVHVTFGAQGYRRVNTVGPRHE